MTHDVSTVICSQWALHNRTLSVVCIHKGGPCVTLTKIWTVCINCRIYTMQLDIPNL